MRNVAVDLGVFADSGVTQPVVERYVRSRHLAQPYVPFGKGFIQATCSPNEHWDSSHMPGWNKDWTAAVQSSSVPPNCGKWVDHNVLVVQRDTFANFYHDSEDMVNAFLALAILRWSLSDSQVILSDLYPEGPFWWRQD